MISNKPTHLSKRTFSALVAIPLFVLAVYTHALSYFILYIIIMVLAMRECYNLFALSGNTPNKTLGIFIGALVYALTFLYAGGQLSSHYLYLLIPALCAVFVIPLLQQQTPTISSTSTAYTLLGIIYAGTPFSLLHLLAFHGGYYNYQIVLGIMLLLWANDTGAYLVGASIGKHKLLPKISPNKTWEGSLGGILLSMAVSSLLARYFDVLGGWTWIGVGGIVAVAGTTGDLVESMFKRSAGVKDAGRLIPGHGGVLDRFDSFLLAIPAVLTLIKLSLLFAE